MRALSDCIEVRHRPGGNPVNLYVMGSVVPGFYLHRDANIPRDCFHTQADGRRHSLKPGAWNGRSRISDLRFSSPHFRSQISNLKFQILDYRSLSGSLPWNSATLFRGRRFDPSYLTQGPNHAMAILGWAYAALLLRI